MDKERILIVDDDPYILSMVRLILENENYEISEAKDGKEAIDMVHERTPHLIILDYMMPVMDGLEVCIKLKKDTLFRHIPIIMLTAKGELTDKVRGLDAGVDDYIVKPFEPQELLARVKMILQRTTRSLDANPLTKLPGNVSITNEIQQRIDNKELFAVCHIDLRQFKAFNDKYGFEHGDRVIRETGRIIIKVIQGIGNPDDFIGHIGGDDFIVITTPNLVDKLCSKIIKDFDTIIPNFYNEQDKRKGYIVSQDRKGNIYEFSIMIMCIGVVGNESRDITHPIQVSEIGADLQSFSKSFKKSNYVKDRRIDGIA
ncbi:MAG: response regulator [bacterium]